MDCSTKEIGETSYFHMGSLISKIEPNPDYISSHSATVECISQCRQISLCNFAFKVIAEVLADRLKNINASIDFPGVRRLCSGA